MDNDVNESRCPGLVAGYALRKEDNQKVEATSVTKSDGPFYCAKCGSEAIVRKCSEKEDHFAHKAAKTPIATKKDKRLHEVA